MVRLTSMEIRSSLHVEPGFSQPDHHLWSLALQMESGMVKYDVEVSSEFKL